MTATIRNGVQSDLEALIAIDDIASSNEARRTQIRDGLLESGIAVAVVDAAPAGYALLTYHFFGQAFLELVYVGAEYRRCGIGSALIRHVLEKTGGSKLFTSTNQSNAPMRALLAKLGFEESGIIHNLDPGDPELIFCWRADRTGSAPAG